MVTSQRMEPAGVSPSSLVVLLEHIESMPAGATGALVLGPESSPRGAVLLEGGRVCWAAARSMRMRLTDLLLAEGEASSRAAIERVYMRCRDEGRPLGETLVASGVVSREGLRRCLERHTAEALATLAEQADDLRFHPHRHRRYDAAFTFAPTDVVRGVAALRWEQAHVERAASLLVELVGPDGSAAAYPAGPEDELPVSTLRANDLGISGLLRLGRWARASLEVGASLGSTPRMVIGRSGTLGGLVAWRTDDLVLAAACPDPSTVSWIVARAGRGR